MRLLRVLLAGVLLLPACGKSKQATNKDEKTGEPVVAAEPALTVENAPFASVIASKGYRVVHARRFPAQLASRRATMVVYQSRDGKSGGVIYTQNMANAPDRVAWHWIFTDGAPDSVQPVEINNDGLWDTRIFMKGGKVVDLVQGQGFTFMGPEREGLVALNGQSSAPAELWKCFDGDTATVWLSPTKDAYIELPNPFGLTTGELTVRLADSDRPKDVEVVAGTATQKLDLAQTSAEQNFKLEAALIAAPSIRLKVEGAGEKVAISELAIR